MPTTPSLSAAVGRRIRSIRHKRSWSLLALATGAAVSTRFLTEVEAGRANPSLTKLAAVASALGVPLRALFPELATGPGPRSTIERTLDGRSYDELEAIDRYLQLTYATPTRRIIVLLGVRGAGKSTVGARLGAVLGCPFVELDEHVEARAGLPLAALFDLHGEAYYRQIEQHCLADLMRRDEPTVVATGGGIVEHLASFELILRHAQTVWLDARAETLWERVVAQGDTRPMAGRDAALTQLRLLLERRNAAYRRALVRVDTDAALPDRLVGEIAEQLQHLQADRAVRGIS
jgi:XRE family transcriptional regulator, aerobic/anaerobic benzoate catabolism transcriptional regulator